MPRMPDLARNVKSIMEGDFGRPPQSPVESPAHLHIGDSAESPGSELPLAADLGRVNPYWYRYPAPAGTGRLRRALAGYYTDHHDLPTAADQILVTPGATAGLNTLVHLLCDPGDEVIVPTPAWPLFPGMVRLAGAVPVQVPLHDAMADLTADEVAGRIEAAVTPHSAVLYLNTPNNPSGTLMNESQRRAALAVAKKFGLWVISDEAYDGMAFDGHATPPLATLDDQVIVVSTASKMHRAAGLRIGWMRGNPQLIAAATRVATFQNYSASAAAQALLEPAVRSRAEWAPIVLAELQERRDRFMEALALDAPSPRGTYFAFLDLRPWLGESFDARDALPELNELGVFVTAGAEFGEDYRGWLRACFASEPLDRTTDAATAIGAWVRDRGSRRT